MIGRLQFCTVHCAIPRPKAGGVHCTYTSPVPTGILWLLLLSQKNVNNAKERRKKWKRDRKPAFLRTLRSTAYCRIPLTLSNSPGWRQCPSLPLEGALECRGKLGQIAPVLGSAISPTTASTPSDQLAHVPMLPRSPIPFVRRTPRRKSGSFSLFSLTLPHLQLQCCDPPPPTSLLAVSFQRLPYQTTASLFQRALVL